MKCEDYINVLYRPPQFPEGAPCSRWWALSDRILVGGSIVSKEDGAHLVRDFGIDAVVSVESERDDEGRWVGNSIYMPFPDVGDAPKPEIFRSILQFSRRCVRDMLHAKFYVHCQMGGSRSPAVALLLMRGLFGLSAPVALEAVRQHKPGYGDHEFHRAYLSAVEEALQ